MGGETDPIFGNGANRVLASVVRSKYLDTLTRNPPTPLFPTPFSKTQSTSQLAKMLRAYSAQATDAATTRWIYHYNIPAAVPIETGISFADLARKVNLSERTLTRVLRHTMTNNVFIEDTPGHVSHTSYSLLLAKPGNPIRGMVGHRSEVMFPIMSKLVEAHDRYGTVDQSANHTGFQVAFNSEERMLDWVASDPVASVRFAESMKTAASSGPFNMQYIAQSFDWESLDDGLVVDVSGRIVNEFYNSPLILH